MPKFKEARRRLNLFVNSLFMDISDFPSNYNMSSWNLMTRSHSEDGTYVKVDFERCTGEFSASTLLYLQALLRTDWNICLGRLYQYIMKKKMVKHIYRRSTGLVKYS